MAQKNKTRKLLTKNIVDIGQAIVSLHIPGEVITDDISAAWVEVGEGNILRVEVAGPTYVAFDDKTTGGVVTSATSPAVKLTAGIHYVVCQCKYVRADANPTRIERLQA